MKTKDFLKKLGVSTAVRGYYYLAFMIETAKEELKDNKPPQIVKLYKICAKEFKTTPQRVERVIRNAIETSFENISDLCSEVFKNVIITNGSFVYGVADYLNDLDEGD